MGATIECKVMCAYHMVINKEYSIYGLVNSRKSVEVFMCYYLSNIILHSFFIHPTAHYHLDPLATLHI
jgi:hypothetical protein